MKKKIIAILALTAIFGACSSDDTSNDTSSANIFLPLSVGNYWTYNVSGSGITSRDSLYVANDTVIDGETYAKMKTLALPAGFYSSSMRQNAVRKVNSSLVVRGTSAFNLGGVLPIGIAMNDFVVFRENANDQELIGTVTGETTQDYQGTPLTLNYTMTSTAGQSLSTYSVPGGQQFNDVKQVHITISMSISTTLSIAGFDVDVPILATQDVVSSTQYYAKDIGMVYATTTISYNLEDFSQAGIDLPIPPSSSVTQTETLDTFQAN